MGAEVGDGCCGEARGHQDHQHAQGACWQRLCGTYRDSAAEVLGGVQTVQPTLRTSADGGRWWGRGSDCPAQRGGLRDLNDEGKLPKGLIWWGDVRVRVDFKVG